MVDTFLIGGEALLPGGALAAVDIRLSDGVIADIGTNLRIPRGSTVVPVKGFAMPGLIDAHTHLFWAGHASMPSTLDEVRRRASDNWRRLLDYGVTTVRDVGSIDGVALEASDGPRVFSANQIVCAVGGHGTETAAEWASLPKSAWEASGPVEFRAGVRRQVERGAHLDE